MQLLDGPIQIGDLCVVAWLPNGKHLQFGFGECVRDTDAYSIGVRLIGQRHSPSLTIVRKMAIRVQAPSCTTLMPCACAMFELFHTFVDSNREWNQGETLAQFALEVIGAGRIELIVDPQYGQWKDDDLGDVLVAVQFHFQRFLSRGDDLQDCLVKLQKSIASAVLSSESLSSPGRFSLATTTFAMLILLSVLGGCGNPYSKFYVGDTADNMPGVIFHEGQPKLYPSADLNRDASALLENGFAMLGYSSFNSPSVNQDLAVNQGEKVGAALVLVQNRHTHTVSGSIPYTVQNPSQTVTAFHSGSISGPSGFGSYSGYSTATVPGGYSTYQMPYQVQRFDYLATYWAETKPPILGVFACDLPFEIRKKLGRNSGALVITAIKDSPAYNADMIPGDVITMLSGEPISDWNELSALLVKHAGKEVVIQTFRETDERLVTVQLNPVPQ